MPWHIFHVTDDWGESAWVAAPDEDAAVEAAVEFALDEEGSIEATAMPDDGDFTVTLVDETIAEAQSDYQWPEGATVAEDSDGLPKITAPRRAWIAQSEKSGFPEVLACTVR